MEHRLAAGRVDEHDALGLAAPPFRQAEVDIMYNQGISTEGDVLDLAVIHGIVDKAGAWFSYKDAKIGQGREASMVYLRENPKVMAEIEKAVRD